MRNKNIILVGAKSGEKLALDSMEPIAICYLSSYLMKAGFKTRVIHQKPHESNKEISNRIIKEKPFIVGFSTYASNYHNSLSIAKMCKKKIKTKTIFGGYHASKYPKLLLTAKGGWIP